MKKLLIIILCSIGIISCKKKEVEINSTPREVINFKLVNNNGVDLINGPLNPVLTEDLILEYLIDGKRLVPSIDPRIQLDEPYVPVSISNYYNPNIFDGKTVNFEPNITADQTTLKATSYLTIKNKGTFKVEVELLKAGVNSTNGKVWVNDVLLRTDRSGGDKPITLVVN
ncbi:hypothetical protein [Pedobacter frigiditerrae]|uniref:hypothetical protein n=1 Tax=Pedobacter frigiditerrae TaxID=2530452 RepID=UPI00292E83C2|nr:hypothetical protein [Pedobacter frigiditerrae]